MTDILVLINSKKYKYSILNFKIQTNLTNITNFILNIKKILRYNVNANRNKFVSEYKDTSLTTINSFINKLLNGCKSAF